MIMTIDVGNTNITVGVFRGDEVVSNFRITTKMPRTSDEYGMLLSNLLEQNSISHDDIEDAIIASVVPNVMHSLEGAIIKYFSIRPIIVEPGTKTGIRVVTENPRQIGADRIVDAAAAYELYGGPVLVLDFGTATTYDLVDKDGAFVSGVTAPGIRISAKALWEDAAKLPEIEIRKPASILAKETISSMQAGLVYGQIGQTEYIIRHMIDEANMGEVKVVATGGAGHRAQRAGDVHLPRRLRGGGPRRGRGAEGTLRREGGLHQLHRPGDRQPYRPQHHGSVLRGHQALTPSHFRRERTWNGWS